MGFLLLLCQKMVGIILKYFDLGALRRCEKNHKVLNFSSDYIKKSIHIKSMEQVKWNTKGKWGKTHLQAEDDSNFLFGKAVCGVVFQHYTPNREVNAGNLVNCPRCLVKIGWAKVIKRNKVKTKHTQHLSLIHI